MIFKEIYVSRKEPIRIQTTQYTNAVPLVFRIIDWEIPSGAIAQIYVKKPSGTMVFNNADIDDNDIVVTATTQMTAEVGENEGQIRVEANSKVLHTFVFILEVSETIIDDSAIESTDEFTALETALAEVENFVPKTAVASKGSATQPVYFDANGVAQNTTYPLTLNGVNQAGIVPAPTASKPHYLYDTDTNGNPQWENFNNALTPNYCASVDGSSFNKNFLLISSDAYQAQNRRAFFSWTDTTKSEYSGIPTVLDSVSGSVIGVREVFVRSSTHILVKVTEMYPFWGRVHYNFLNSGSWGGWRCSKPARRIAYTVSGYLMDSSAGTVKGYGTVKFQQLESTGIIDFEVQVTTAGTVSSDYTAGISVATLQAIQSGIPDITTMNGIIHYYTSAGALNTAREGYAGIAIANASTGRWNFGRTYNTSGSNGAWADSSFAVGDRIVGTLYGEISY